MLLGVGASYRHILSFPGYAQILSLGLPYIAPKEDGHIKTCASFIFVDIRQI